MMDQFIEFCFGIGATIALGAGVGQLLEITVPKPTRPKSIKEKDWQLVFELHGVGGPIGFFERLLSLVAFWISQEYILIVGWLAFKVAAKWEAWKNIRQIPTSLPGINPLAWFRIRNAFGSWVLSRYLVGTLVNILIGALGMYLGKNSFVAIDWLRSLLD
jgi:hypothetical protein